MKQALIMTAALSIALVLLQNVVGRDAALALGFGAIAVIAAINAATFLWLWWARATPLALGMACTWTAQALILIVLLPRAPEMRGTAPLDATVLALLSLYIVGGALHIGVMQRSMELRPAVLVLPLLGACALAAASFAIH